MFPLLPSFCPYPLILPLRYDEHMSLREVNNRYVHKQMKISDNGGVDIFGVTTKF
jgi:hypothetical protein